MIGEILKLQETIYLIREMDGTDKWWRSPAKMKVARETIRATGNPIKYGLTEGDDGKGTDGWRRLEKIMAGATASEHILVLKVRVAWEEACRILPKEIVTEDRFL